SRDEGLEQDGQDTRAEHHEEWGEQPPVQGRRGFGDDEGRGFRVGDEGDHSLPPSSAVPSASVSASTPFSTVRSTAGLIASSIGCGYSPNTISRARSGPIAHFSPTLRSSGPVMVRWYIHRM